MAAGVLEQFYATEYQLRDRNGVLELALLLACDRLREHEGGTEPEWVERLLDAAEQRLREEGRLPRPFLRQRQGTARPGREGG